VHADRTFVVVGVGCLGGEVGSMFNSGVGVGRDWDCGRIDSRCSDFICILGEIGRSCVEFMFVVSCQCLR